MKIQNAVLVPFHRASGRILVQNRRGHKSPPWGFFGGAIKTGETPLQAVVREAREELSISLSPTSLTYFGEHNGQFWDLNFTLHAFLWPFDGNLRAFEQREGAGMELVSADEMLRPTELGGPDHTLTLMLKRSL